jgi:hypothetical protein
MRRAAIWSAASYNLRVVTELYLGSTVLSVMWIAATALVASCAVIAISRQRGADRGSIVHWLVMVWFTAALAAVVILTLQPGPGGFGAARPSRFDPISRIHTQDALDNVVMYLPVGIFGALLWSSKPRPVVWAAGFAFSVSLTVEVAQWVLPINRAATTHDVLFNTVGGLIGAVVGILVVRLGSEAG